MAVRGYWKGGAYLLVTVLWAVVLVGVVLTLVWLFLQVGGWLR